MGGFVCSAILRKSRRALLPAAGDARFLPVRALRSFIVRLVRVGAHGEQAARAITAPRNILKIPDEDRRKDGNDSNELKAFHGDVLLFSLKKLRFK